MRRVLSAALCALLTVPAGGFSASFATSPRPAPRVAEQALTAAGLWALQSLQPFKASRKRREIRFLQPATGLGFGWPFIFSEALESLDTGGNPFGSLKEAIGVMDDAHILFTGGEWDEAARLAFSVIYRYPEARMRLGVDKAPISERDKQWKRLVDDARQITGGADLLNEHFASLVDEWKRGPEHPAVWANRVVLALKAVGSIPEITAIDPMLPMVAIAHLIMTFESAARAWDVALTTKNADDALRLQMRRCLDAVFALAIQPRAIVPRQEELAEFLNNQHSSLHRSADERWTDYILDVVNHPELEGLLYVFEVYSDGIHALWRARAARSAASPDSFDARMLNALVWEFSGRGEALVLTIVRKRWPSSGNPPLRILERLFNDSQTGFAAASAWRRNIERLIIVMRSLQRLPPYIAHRKAWFTSLSNDSSLSFYTRSGFALRLQSPGEEPSDWIVWPVASQWHVQRATGGPRQTFVSGESAIIGDESDAEIVIHAEHTLLTIYTQLHNRKAAAKLILPSPFRQYPVTEDLLYPNLRLLERLLTPGTHRLYVDASGGVVDYAPSRNRNAPLPEPLRQGQYMTVNIGRTGLVEYPRDMHIWVQRNGRWKAQRVSVEWLHPEVLNAFQRINKRIEEANGALGIATRAGLWWSMAYVRLRSWARRLDSPSLHAKADHFAHAIAEAETLHLFMARLPAVIGLFFDPSLEPAEGARYITYALIEIVIEEDHPSVFHGREPIARIRTPADTAALRAFFRLMARPLQEFLAMRYATLLTFQAFHHETSLIKALSARHEILLRERFAGRPVQYSA